MNQEDAVLGTDILQTDEFDAMFGEIWDHHNEPNLEIQNTGSGTEINYDQLQIVSDAQNDSLLGGFGPIENELHLTSSSSTVDEIQTPPQSIVDNEHSSMDTTNDIPKSSDMVVVSFDDDDDDDDLKTGTWDRPDTFNTMEYTQDFDDDDDDDDTKFFDIASTPASSRAFQMVIGEKELQEIPRHVHNIIQLVSNTKVAKLSVLRMKDMDEKTIEKINNFQPFWKEYLIQKYPQCVRQKLSSHPYRTKKTIPASVHVDEYISKDGNMVYVDREKLQKIIPSGIFEVDLVNWNVYLLNLVEQFTAKQIKELLV
jgi:hypothetical protein